MAFNWKNIVNTLNAFRSPKQAINWMLDRGAQKDPQMAAALRKMVNSGEDPSKVLMQLASTGQITLQQLTQIKSYYNAARKLGFKYQIPEETWTQAQRAIEAGSAPKKKFTGF